jgi:hypothetical protein
MFRAIVQTQWKWSRGVVLLATVLTFAIPLLSLRSARIGDGGGGGGFLTAMTMWSVAYALTAAGLGLVLAITAWSADHRGRHVYSLTLPVERWQYVLMRFGAGSLFILPPVAAVLVAGEIVAHGSGIPLGLHAYPAALAVRFGLAALVAFSLFFAITSATARTAGLILGGIGVVAAAHFVLIAAEVHFDPTSYVVDALVSGPGLLAVFAGRWMLIDV